MKFGLPVSRVSPCLPHEPVADSCSGVTAAQGVAADQAVWSRRRLGGVVLAALGLGGCGFKLRGNQTFAFTRIAIMPNPGGAIARDLRRSFGPAVQVLAADEPISSAQLVLQLVNEQRERVVVGVNASGQVRELQLRMGVRLHLTTANGDAIAEDADISQQRDISYFETAALAKEAEEALLFRDMQSDIVQQILRRLAAVRPAQLN